MSTGNTNLAARRAIVEDLIAVGGFLNGAIPHLYTNPVGTSPDVVIGDFTEADFDGYAAGVAATWGAVGTEVSGLASVTPQEYEWVPTGTTTPNVVVGGYLTDAAGTTLLCWEEFTTPIGVNGPPDVVRWVPKFELPLQN